MDSNKRTALIECGSPEESFLTSFELTSGHVQINKAYILNERTKGAFAKRFPQLEIAKDCNAIFHDESIGLVLISAPSNQHRMFIGEALKANKQVQIV